MTTTNINPSGENQAMSTTYKSIDSRWTDTTNWGIFGSRRKVQILFNQEGQLAGIQLISQSLLERLISWVGKSFGWGEESRRTIEKLPAHHQTFEIWKKAMHNLKEKDFANLLTLQLETTIRKNPIEIAERIHQATSTLDLRVKTEEFKKHLEPFGVEIEREWDVFIQEKFGQRDISGLAQEIIKKEKSTIEKCRADILQEIENVLKEGDVNANTPPLLERYRQLPYPSRGLESVVKSRESSWIELQRRIEKADSIEEIESEYEHILNAQIFDDALFEIMRKNSSKGIVGCQKAAQAKAIEFLQKLSPGLLSPAAITPELIEERLQFYNTPSVKKTLSSRDVDALQDFNIYVQCMHLMQEAAAMEK